MIIEEFPKLVKYKKDNSPLSSFEYSLRVISISKKPKGSQYIGSNIRNTFYIKNGDLLLVLSKNKSRYSREDNTYHVIPFQAIINGYTPLTILKWEDKYHLLTTLNGSFFEEL